MVELLLDDEKPFFIVGQEKNSGKTVTLNRLRAEAGIAGLSDFAMCTIGFDGEDKDHLSGKPKPTVMAHKNDIVLTCASLLSVMQARVEVLWADSYAGSLGRMVLCRVIRAGKVQLVGPRTVKQLNKIILLMRNNGARHILIDGAADRQTQITAFDGSRVCLTFRPKFKENVSGFCDRIMNKVFLYNLPKYESDLPFEPEADEILLFNGQEFEIMKADELESLEDRMSFRSVYVKGPCTSDVMSELDRLGFEKIILRNPSHVFADTRIIARTIAKKRSIEYLDKPELACISVRSYGGRMRSVPPQKLIDELVNRVDVPCFDAMYSSFSQQDCI